MSGMLLLALRIALAALLYGFAGWALFVLWRDIVRQGRQAVSRQAPPIILRSQAQTLRFNTPEVTIGRDPASTCLLEDQTVSAHHARLFYRQGQWWVEDLRSTNGTYLNQEPVNTLLVLAHGDELRFGQVVMNILMEPAAQEPGAPAGWETPEK
jgi:hypothetical protein